MTNLNCPNCKARKSFTKADDDKYTCENCNKEFNQCKVDQCTNLVNHGVVCKECVGKGIKNGGVTAGALLLAAGGFAAKLLSKRK